MTEVSTEHKADYPYYRGEPLSLGGRDWFIVLVALAVGFLFVSTFTLASVLGPAMDGLFRSTMFVAVPLAALAWCAGPHWKALFNGWRWSHAGWGVLFGLLNLAFTFVIGTIALRYLDLADNALVSDLGEGLIPGGPAFFYIDTAIQLLGEELVTILPFLFLLWLGTSRLGLSRGHAIIVGWLGSALLFGALHLPTYEWNVVQALLLIGPVRLVLTLAYMKTKSLWASTIAHVLNDWSLFTFAVVLGGAASSS